MSFVKDIIFFFKYGQLFPFDTFENGITQE